MLFGASLFFKSEHKDSSNSEPLWEESIILIEAEDDQAAQVHAENFGKQRQIGYESANGDFVSWTFMMVERIVPIEDQTVRSGSELFSRYLRDAEVKSILTPFED